MGQLGQRGEFERRFGGSMNPPAPPRKPQPRTMWPGRPPVAPPAPPPEAGPGRVAKASTAHPARRADLRTGSDVLRFCEGIRAHEMGGADAVREKAQEVYKGIIRASNWPFGINKRMAAVRMRRSLRKVANALELSARSAAAARKTWTDVVGSGTKIARSNGFDPTR